MRFEGKVAVVTGGSSGIGRATALQFAREGATVVIADVTEHEAVVVAEELQTLAPESFHLRCDVGNPSDVASMIGLISSRFGRLDFAVNNAGIEGPHATIADTEDDDWRRTINVNLDGVFYCLKHEMRFMQQQKSGAIVNVSSIFGQVAASKAPAYVASKHAVIGLTRSAALEGAPFGIRVNAVCPGYIETPMVMNRGLRAADDPQTRADIAARAPLNRMGTPQEIAHVIAWLCSDEASFITGHPLVADGGFVVR
jgi:NAD(P)-dependent dehydrogenase (short-subunit alcohol dehydrogenase family)